MTTTETERTEAECTRIEIANVCGVVRDVGVQVSDELEMLVDAVVQARPERVCSRGRVLAGELTRVAGELVRVDAKTSILASLGGAGLLFLLGQDPARLPLGSQVLLGLAVTALAGSALFLLLKVLRPCFGAGGFNLWAVMAPEEVLEALTDVDEDAFMANELTVLSGIAGDKFRAVRLGVDLLGVAVALMAAAFVVGVIW